MMCRFGFHRWACGFETAWADFKGGVLRKFRWTYCLRCSKWKLL